MEIGTIVKYNKDYGIVEWNENRCMNLNKEDGYIGIKLLTGSRGFVAPVGSDKVAIAKIDDVVNAWSDRVNEIMQSLSAETSCKKELDNLKNENKLLKNLLILQFQN